MRKTNLIFTLTALFFSAGLLAQTNTDKKPYRDWWNEYGWVKPNSSKDAKKLALIKVSGNKFVNPKGEAILFRGLSISDPDKIEKQGMWNKKHFEEVKKLGTMLVRIPVHPVAWRDRTPEKYLALLDQAVQWCTDLGMYVIIDWHTIGNLEMEMFQDPMYNTTKRETFDFWRHMAVHFSGHNTVAFFEIFNEPTTYRGTLGEISWSEWKDINEKIIRMIRAYDPEKIPLVAGFDWAYDLSPLHDNPINAEGIGYVTHPYPHKRSQPWIPKWEENFGFAADKYPVIATEIGYWDKPGDKKDAENYGPTIIKYLEGRGISWTAWVFDPEWNPQMLKSWNYELTDMGEFFKKAMQGQVK